MSHHDIEWRCITIVLNIYSLIIIIILPLFLFFLSVRSFVRSFVYLSACACLFICLLFSSLLFWHSFPPFAFLCVRKGDDDGEVEGKGLSHKPYFKFQGGRSVTNSYWIRWKYLVSVLYCVALYRSQIKLFLFLSCFFRIHLNIFDSKEFR